MPCLGVTAVQLALIFSADRAAGRINMIDCLMIVVLGAGELADTSSSELRKIG
jgi:hypothetical protein